MLSPLLARFRTRTLIITLATSPPRHLTISLPRSPGFLTLSYTAYGGLLVSIFTDTIQGIASVFFFLILALYMAITFRPGSLPQDSCMNVTTVNDTLYEYCYSALPCPPSLDGFAACVSGTPDCSSFDAIGAPSGTCPIAGYSSILTMPLALFAATVFSEAMWQRCWASSDTKNLRKGAWVGAAITIVIVWFAGFTGLLTIWAEGPALTYGDDVILDRWNSTSNAMEPTAASQRPNYDLYMFQVLYDGKYPDVGKNASFGFVTEDEYSTNGLLVYPSIQNWMGVILVALAVVMNEGAVDSIQNGMATAVTSFFGPIIPRWNLWYTRGAIVLLNALLVGIGAWLSLDNVEVSVIQLFLIANQLSICFFIPVLMGLSKKLQRYVGGGSFLFSGIFSVICVCIYGVNYYYTTYPDGWVDPFTGRVYAAGSFADAMHYTWLGNGYAWDFFLVPACVSLGCMLLCIGIFALFAHVPAAASLLKKLRLDPDMPIWGLKSVANHPYLYEDGNAKRFGATTDDDVLKTAELTETGKSGVEFEPAESSDELDKQIVSGTTL